MYKSFPATGHQGLSAAQVEESRRLHGSNRILPPEREPWWNLYLEKFDDPIIRILMVAAVLAILTGFVRGDHYEGIAIIITIFLATFLGFLNEWRARGEFDLLLQAREDTPVKVIREGTATKIPRADLVVGDVAIVETGDEVPADGLILEATSLTVDESRLTGESFPVGKIALAQLLGTSPGDTGCEPADRTPPEGGCAEDAVQNPVRESSDAQEIFPAHLAFRGTMVTDGFGILRVTAVGSSTEAGQAAEAAAEDFGETTPLGRQLEKLGAVISFFGFTGAVMILLALMGRGFLTGEFAISLSQFTALLAVGAGLIAASPRIWLPLAYEALAQFGVEVTVEGLFDDEPGRSWWNHLSTGVLISAVILLIAIVAGILPPSPFTWFTPELGRTLLHYFMIVVAVIVVAVPEGLSMAVTLCLAYGMRRMMAQNNLVRRLHACETIGAATVICSDKTGTLTRNEMRVVEFALPGGGRPDSTDFWASESGKVLAEGISANSTANLCRKCGEATAPVGNSTEGALLAWIDRYGIDYLPLRKRFRLEHRWTFCPRRKFMVSLGGQGITGRRLLHLKGAPEQVLERCSMAMTPDGPVPIGGFVQDIQRTMKGFQDRGMRTLAFALREDPPPISLEEGPDLESQARELTWLGVAAIADPVRPEVSEALSVCKQAGVQVKMVTGDHGATAIEIARQIGLWEESDPTDAHLCGGEFQLLSDRQASERLCRVKVLSRAKPLDKLRMVALLKKAGHVVAVTGDGANDAPALNRADVGLSMGRSGTDMAKEASDMVLLDDSFASIATGILWGRCLYLNIQRFLLFQLSINVTALGLTLLGPLLGFPIPLTVLQMLWVNLIMDTFAALALATEPPHPGLMDVPPRKPDEFIINGEMASVIARYGGLSILFFTGLLLVLGRGGTVSPYDLSVFFTTFVLFQFWNLFNARRFGIGGASAFEGIGRNPWFLTVAGIIMTGQVLIVQFGGTLFRTVPLSLRDWLLIFVGTSLTVFLPAGHQKRERQKW